MSVLLYTVLFIVVMVLMKLLSVRVLLKESLKCKTSTDKKFNNVVGPLTQGLVESGAYASLCWFFSVFFKVGFNILILVAIYAVISIICDYYIMFVSNAKVIKITKSTLIVSVIVQIIFVIIFFLLSK